MCLAYMPYQIHHVYIFLFFSLVYSYIVCFKKNIEVYFSTELFIFFLSGFIVVQFFSRINFIMRIILLSESVIL